jgi:ATP-dependent Lhr-like helicase
MTVLAGFHPAVRRWFEGRFPEGPSAPQRAGWPAIARREHTLIAAPTGSGKTLAAFLVCIDELYRRARVGARFGCGPDEPFRLEAEPAVPGARDKVRPPGVEVVYVSPLKALANDIQENLARPLREIEAIARAMGLPVSRSAARCAAAIPRRPSARSSCKRPPQIIVTTPESLYILLGSESGRAMLAGVGTVIVDEIHALAGNKRGAHLALTLERLDALCDRRLTRIGLSATQRRWPSAARFLVGVAAIGGRGQPDCAIVDVGHRAHARSRARELPGAPLSAGDVGPAVWGEVSRSSPAGAQHRSTLVFVNTRRSAERAARHLSEILGQERVAAHHGSLSKRAPAATPRRLKRGELAVLVATSSLELGIDIGDVDLVCQTRLAAQRSRPSCSASAAPATACAGCRRGGSSPPRATSSSNAWRCCGGPRRTGDARSSRPRRSTSWRSRSSPKSVAASRGSEAISTSACAAPPYAQLSLADFTALVRMLAEASRPAAGRARPTCTAMRIGGMLRARRGARSPR